MNLIRLSWNHIIKSLQSDAFLIVNGSTQLMRIVHETVEFLTITVSRNQMTEPAGLYNK